LASSWLLLGYLMAGLRNRGVGYGLGITWRSYALTECRAVVQYLRLALWPQTLILDYGFSVPTGPLAAVAPFALILAVLATGVLFALKRCPAIGFVGAWFFVILAPGSSVVPIAGQPMAEHRMYLPLAAVVTLTVVGAVALGKRLLNQQQGIMLGCVAGGSVAALLTLLTIQRNRDYGSELLIWQDTVEKRPANARARTHLGIALAHVGRLDDAIGQCKEAVRLNPHYADGQINLGFVLFHLGRLQEAIGHYEQALRIQPECAEAHNNLANALAQLGMTQEAIGHYEQALRIKPDYAEAHYNWGVVLVQAGRVQGAIGHYQQALRIKPDYAHAHLSLGNALLRLGKVQEAIDHYEQALRTKPDYADAHCNLGLALERLGRTQEAIGEYEQALRFKPDFVQAQNALARARAVQ
jgi:tetratricopeptide (TPR) repeat protein